MANVPITLTLGNLTTGANYTLQQFAQAIVDRLTATISSGNIFFGQMGGTEPLSPLAGEGATYGLWLNGGVIYEWDVDSAKYIPIPLVTGQFINDEVVTTTILCGALEDRELTTPDKDGTIATTDDIISLFGTQTIGAGLTAIPIDWSIRKQAYIILSGVTTITGTGMQDGQHQDIFLENNTTSHTVTFPGVYWPTGGALAMTAGSANIRKIDHVRLWRVGNEATGVTLGEVVAQGYSISTLGGGSGGDVTPPTPSTITGGGTVIYIKMNELLQGGTLATAGFSVLKNGVANTVTSASASGDTITLNLGTSFGGNATVTVQYTGSSVKDLAGNVAAAFGPSSVSFTGRTGEDDD